MHILTISLGRNILKAGSRERLRMQSYAKHTTSLTIIVLTRTSHGYRDAVHEGNLHIYPTNSRMRLLMLFDAYRIGRESILKQHGEPVVISAQDPLEIGWLSWLLSLMRHTKLHIQVHGDYFSSNAWVQGSIVRRIRRFGAYLLIRKVSAVRVVSKRIAQSLEKIGIAEDRITVLPIRPELEVFLKTERSERSVPPYVFLYIGRLAPEKDTLRILHAFTELHKIYPDTCLRMVGDGEERSTIESYINQHHLHDSVTLLPWTENVAEEMASADVFLLASKHEAYALTLIESLAVGTPVITTDVGCVGEVVEDGVHGIVVRDGGIMSYVDAMKRMISDESFRLSCGKAGRTTVRELEASQSSEAYARAWVTAVLRACPTGILDR